ncbi:MAG: phosphoenolpyruvate carboxykinase, partial [Candidatus Aenigmatarchaeota archaeon]
HIPKYEDLKLLFSEYLGDEYSKEDYEKQFSIRLGKLLEKFKRIEKIYSMEKDIPEKFMYELEKQKRAIAEARDKMGDVVSPSGFE